MDLLILQVITTLITLSFSYFYLRFGFLFSFLLTLNVLLVFPFFLIYLDITGEAGIYQLLHTSVDSKVTLPFSASSRPVVCMLLGQWAIVLGYVSVMPFRLRGLPKLSRDIFTLSEVERTLVRRVTYTLMIICFSYMLIRFSVRPDYPILAYILHGGENLRDIAFEYGSHDGFYLFKPSIAQQFTRIGIPLVLFYTFILYRNGASSLFVLLAVLGITLFLTFGTFKRTPVVYFSLWLLLFAAVMNPRFSFGKAVKYGAVAFIGTVFMTYLYTQDFADAINGLLVRITIGEARGQYLAFLHYGYTFEFERFALLMDYMQKVAGDDVMAFSERWKIVTGGTRGYTSIGVIAEAYVTFGYIGLSALFFFGSMLHFLDRMTLRCMSPVTRPVISGLIAIVAFMATKGFLSQLFTGGALFLLVLLLILYLPHLKYRMVDTVQAAQTGS